MSRHLEFDNPLNKVTEVAYCFDRYYLNPSERLLLRDGRPIELRAKLFETLVILVQHAGRLLTKTELMNHIWPEAFVEETGLARNISDLRVALHDHGHPPRFIETVPKFGYRFLADVSQIVEDREPVFETPGVATDRDR